MLLKANEWAGDLYRPHGSMPYDYIIAYGGRSSSKTFEFSQALALKGAMQPLRICIAREHLKSITESAKQEIEDRASALGLVGPGGYKASQYKIDHANGTHVFFIGLSKVSEEDIKGLAQVDIVWVEEAHTMSHSSLELLRPTIRKTHSQIWFSYNPKYRTDAIAKFQQDTMNDPRVWQRRINWSDNFALSDKSKRDRVRFMESEPERYAHIWEGEYDDVSDKRKVLPFALLRTCVDAWDKRPIRGSFVDAGLDVADTGMDKNALVLPLWSGTLRGEDVARFAIIHAIQHRQTGKGDC